MIITIILVVFLRNYHSSPLAELVKVYCKDTHDSKGDGLLLGYPRGEPKDWPAIVEDSFVLDHNQL